MKNFKLGIFSLFLSTAVVFGACTRASGGEQVNAMSPQATIVTQDDEPKIHNKKFPPHSRNFAGARAEIFQTKRSDFPEVVVACKVPIVENKNGKVSVEFNANTRMLGAARICFWYGRSFSTEKMISTLRGRIESLDLTR